MASWLIAFCSSLAISSSWIALCSSLRVASSSRSSSSVRERSSGGSTERPALGSRSASSKKLTSSKLFAFTTLHRMDFDANRDGAAAVAHLRACSDRRCMFPARLLYRCPELVAQALAGHGEQLAAGLARGHPQIAVGRPRVIEAFGLAVDQDRSGRISLEQ